MAGEVFRTEVEVFTFDIDVADHVSNIVVSALARDDTGSLSSTRWDSRSTR